MPISRQVFSQILVIGREGCRSIQATETKKDLTMAECVTDKSSHSAGSEVNGAGATPIIECAVCLTDVWVYIVRPS